PAVFVESHTAVAKIEPTLTTARILVGGDHDSWRSQIRKILDSRPEWSVVFDAGTGSQTIQKAMELDPDVILLDIGMPQLNGIGAARSVRRNCPGCKVVFVTLRDDAGLRSATLDSGARRYVLKANAIRELVPALTMLC